MEEWKPLPRRAESAAAMRSTQPGDTDRASESRAEFTRAMPSVAGLGIVDAAPWDREHPPTFLRPVRATTFILKDVRMETWN